MNGRMVRNKTSFFPFFSDWYVLLHYMTPDKSAQSCAVLDQYEILEILDGYTGQLYDPHTACSFTHSLIKSCPIWIPASSRSRSVQLPYTDQRRSSSRSSHSVTFIVRRGRCRRNDNAVVAADIFAKGMALGIATGTGDHAAVGFCAEGLHERDSWGRWWCREGKCGCCYGGKEKEHGGVEVMHCCLGDGREEA